MLSICLGLCAARRVPTPYPERNNNVTVCSLHSEYNSGAKSIASLPQKHINSCVYSTPRPVYENKRPPHTTIAPDPPARQNKRIRIMTVFAKQTQFPVMLCIPAPCATTSQFHYAGAPCPRLRTRNLPSNPINHRISLAIPQLWAWPGHLAPGRPAIHGGFDQNYQTNPISPTRLSRKDLRQVLTRYAYPPSGPLQKNAKRSTPNRHYIIDGNETRLYPTDHLNQKR